MEIGVVSVDSSVFALIGVGIVAWAVLKFRIIPSCEQKDRASRGTEIVRSSARLRVYKGLRTIAISLTVTPAIVAIIYIVAQIRIEGSADDPERIQKVVATRDLLERGLGQFTGVTVGTWIAMLIVLAAIWLIARNSSSRRRWRMAIGARRRAYAASLATEPIESLLTVAETEDSERFLRMKAEIEMISKTNLAQIEALESAQVLQLPRTDGSTIATSIAELRATIAQFEHEAEQLETTS